MLKTFPTRVIEREIGPHETPYSHIVPKGFYANLVFRKSMIRLGSSRPEYAENLWRMCSRDILFYINTFAWTHDPRPEVKELPFITYEFQDDVILEIKRCIEEGEDLPIEKSRDMGATWMILMVYEWMWHFKGFNNFLIVSRNKDLVDKTNSPATLFWKIDNILNHQPGWLVPATIRTDMSLVNLDNSSVIDGESTTGDVARGGRYLSILLDEFATVSEGKKVLSSTRDATRCRIVNSTPKGKANAFFKFISKAVHKLTLHWTLHPGKAKGLTYDSEGRPTSPWYENELVRASDPMEIAQELDIDYLGSDYIFFTAKVIDKLKDRDACRPFYRGDLEFSLETCRPMKEEPFRSVENGPLRLWFHPLQDGSVPQGRYALGVDIAVGTGSSNSVVSVIDRDTGRKMAEYVNSRIPPHELAKVAVALARWFRGRKGSAFMAWEANGPGFLFGEQVIATGFRNFHYRQDRTSMKRTVSDKPGWWSTQDTKMALLGEYRRALSRAEFIQYSMESFEECEAYVFTTGGRVVHSATLSNDDPTDSGENHGDRVIADALAWMIAMSDAKTIPEAPLPEYGFGARFNARREAERKSRIEETAWAM